MATLGRCAQSLARALNIRVQPLFTPSPRPRRRRNRLQKRRPFAPSKAPSYNDEPPRKLKKPPPIIDSYNARLRQRELHDANLAIFQARFDNERIVGQLLDAQSHVAKECRKRADLENRLRGISRIVEGLGFDTGMTMLEEERDASAPENIFNVPDRLHRIRSHVQRLNTGRNNDFDNAGDLKRELDDMRETFADRERAWWRQEISTRRNALLLHTLQLEYGMSLWRYKGMEFELLAAHRELDGLYNCVECTTVTETRLKLSDEVNAQLSAHREGQQRYIEVLEERIAELRIQIRAVTFALRQQTSEAEGYAQQLRQLSELRGESDRDFRSQEERDTAKFRRQRKVESYGSYATQSTAAETLINASPKKSVRFDLSRPPTPIAQTEPLICINPPDDSN